MEPLVWDWRSCRGFQKRKIKVKRGKSSWRNALRLSEGSFRACSVEEGASRFIYAYGEALKKWRLTPLWSSSVGGGVRTRFRTSIYLDLHNQRLMFAWWFNCQNNLSVFVMPRQQHLWAADWIWTSAIFPGQVSLLQSCCRAGLTICMEFRRAGRTCPAAIWISHRYHV